MNKLYAAPAATLLAARAQTGHVGIHTAAMVCDAQGMAPVKEQLLRWSYDLP